MHLKYTGDVTVNANGNYNTGLGPEYYIVSVSCISTDDVVVIPFLTSTHTKWWIHTMKPTTNYSVYSGTFNFQILYFKWDSFD